MDTGGMSALAAMMPSSQSLRLGGFFLFGLAGGLTHCTAMCGPFVLWQISRHNLPLEAVTPWGRLRIGLLPLYHLGRLTTYSFLGLLVFGFKEALTSWAPILSPLAGLLFLALGAAFAAAGLQHFFRLLDRAPTLRALLGARGKFLESLGRALWRGVLRIYKGKASAPPFQTGIWLGFLPCGFFYSALGLSLLLQNIWSVAAAVAAFWAGTTLPLMSLGGLGGFSWRRPRIGAAVVCLAYLWGSWLFLTMGLAKLSGHVMPREPAALALEPKAGM